MSFRSSLHIKALGKSVRVAKGRGRIHPIFRHRKGVRRIATALQNMGFRRGIASGKGNLIRVSVSTLSSAALGRTTCCYVTLDPRGCVSTGMEMDNEGLAIASTGEGLRFGFGGSMGTAIRGRSANAIICVSLVPVLGGTKEATLSVRLRTSKIVSRDSTRVALSVRGPKDLFTNFKKGFHLRGPTTSPGIVSCYLRGLHMTCNHIRFP